MFLFCNNFPEEVLYIKKQSFNKYRGKRFTGGYQSPSNHWLPKAFITSDPMPLSERQDRIWDQPFDGTQENY